MTLRRALVMGAFAGGLAWPQDAATQPPTPIRIHGVVTEIGVGGLAAAQVTVYEFAGPEREKKVFATGVTNGAGVFTFELARFGDYWVEVKKEAYFASIPVEGPSAQVSLGSQKPASTETGTLVTVSAEHPTAQVRLALMRPGTMTGTVLDEDDKPLPHVLVELWMAGAPELSRSTARADDKGVFQTLPLMPGEYIVKFSPPANGKFSPPANGTLPLPAKPSAPSDLFAGPLPKYADGDLEMVDDDLEPVYWPAAPDEASAAPVRVYPGAPASVGNVRIRRTPSYRVRISIHGCRPENLPSISIVAHNGGTLGFTPAARSPFAPKLASCDDVLLRGIKPGSYTFLLLGDGQWAAAEVEIGNKNREVTLALAAAAEVSGRFVAAADDVKLPDLSNVRIQLAPEGVGAPFFMPQPQLTAPDGNAAFLARNVWGTAYRVSCTRLSSQYYIKEIRVDGQAAPGGIVRLYPGSKLEIVIDDHPATLTGSVTDGEDGFSQPLIFLVKQPSNVEAAPHPVTGDNSGQFQISGLEPGEYRVVAVPSTPLPDGEQIKFEMLGRLWSNAERVTLERGDTKALPLKLSDPFE